jgi:hypothetical protein
MTSDRFFDNLRRPCPLPVGARIELLAMPNDPDPVPAGTRGTVTGGNGGQVYVNWDNGRTLMLIPGEDSYRQVVEEA